MAKKTLKKKVQAKPDVGKYAAPVVDSAREIWLAGLGAFSMAQQESSKLVEQGNKLFEKLVSEGSKLEKKTRDAGDDAVGEIRSSVRSRVGAAKEQAADNWDKLEGIFEERVARVLGRLGVPTADDVNQLSERVGELSKQVSAMNRAQAATKKASKPKASKKKAASKTTASKKKTASKGKAPSPKSGASGSTRGAAAS